MTKILTNGSPKRRACPLCLSPPPFSANIYLQVPDHPIESLGVVQKLSSIKLVSVTISLTLITTHVFFRVQKNAKDPDTFAQNVLSLPASQYLMMMRAFHLPSCAIETTATVGPMFWVTCDGSDGRFLRQNVLTLSWIYILTRDQKLFIEKRFPRPIIQEGLSLSCRMTSGHA